MSRLAGSPFRPDDPILHEEDLSAVAEIIPPSYRLRGMLFSRLTRDLPPATWEGLAPSLREPPEGGRYVAFQSYPFADYHELLLACARVRFPALGRCEAVRRLARDDFTTFAESMIGRVSLRLIAGPRSALLRMPGIYEAMAAGEWQVKATELDAVTVRIEFESFFGVWPYQVGQLEEVVVRLGGRPEIDAHRPHARALTLDVRHG